MSTDVTYKPQNMQWLNHGRHLFLALAKSSADIPDQATLWGDFLSGSIKDPGSHCIVAPPASIQDLQAHLI